MLIVFITIITVSFAICKVRPRRPASLETSLLACHPFQVKVCVCVCRPCTRGLSNFARDPRATGWLEPAKNHPVCCVNLPAKSCSWVTEWQLGNATKFLPVMYIFSCFACFNKDSRV